MSASLTNPDLQPVCQNCTTSTTPLWRRDELGSVLCNACGLFLKLHNRPRPITLRTDVIKSRNRAKNNGQGPRKKTYLDPHMVDPSQQYNGAAHHTNLMLNQRRSSQISANGHSDGSNSPVSRTATPSMYAHLPNFSGALLDEPQYSNQNSPLAAMHLQPSPGRSASPLSALDIPQTYEQLLAQNAALKTRVSELEVINELFRGRVTQLEQGQNDAKLGMTTPEGSLEERLHAALSREADLKHEIDSLRREMEDRAAAEPPQKKAKLDGEDDSTSKDDEPGSAAIER